jgi:hypothetical protein
VLWILGWRRASTVQALPVAALCCVRRLVGQYWLQA